MRNLLADLCIEAESHTCMAMFMAKAFDDYYTNSSSNGSGGSSSGSIAEQQQQQRREELVRVGVSVSKYFITKRLPGFIYECMEVMGKYCLYHTYTVPSLTILLLIALVVHST